MLRWCYRKKLIFLFPQIALSLQIWFYNYSHNYFLNMDFQAPFICFFVHQTVQNTIYLQGRQINFTTETCYSWLGVYLPDDLDID